MTIAAGIKKQVRYKKESAWGTAPGATGAQLLRRVKSDLDLSKQTYESKELSTHQQNSDFRHGMRSASGSINGELSLGTFQDFLAAALRKAWASGSSSGALTDVTASATAPHFVRASGSWLTDGFKVGDVIQWTGWTQTGNNSKNYRITALTATDMTVGESVTANSSGDSVTATVQGKKLWIPTSGQTDDSFSIEHYFSDITESELFTGMKVSKVDIKLPPSGMAEITISLIGKDVTTDTSEYFTTPTAETTTAIMASVNGVLRVGGTDYAIITGMDISIDCGMTAADGVVGSNTVPGVFQGKLKVTGNLTAYFEDTTLRDAFLNETEVAANVKLDATSSADTDCMVFDMSRIKLGGSKKDDGEKGLIQSVPFTALLNTSGGAGTAYEETTISIQDTSIT